MALDQRRVRAPHLPRLDLLRQPAVGLVAARDDHQPRGVLVEAMDDPGPPRILAAPKQVPQHVHEGRATVPAAAWTTKPAGFSITASHSSACRMLGWRLTSSRVSPPVRIALPGCADRREHQPQGSQGDRHVGEVEGGPQREVDEIGHSIGAHPVGEIAERAAYQQAYGKRQPWPPRIDREPGDHQRQGDDGHHEHESLPLADPERQPPVGGVSEVYAEYEVLPLADGQRGDDDRFGHLVYEDDRTAGSKRQAPDGDRLARLRRAQPRISPTTTLCMISSRMIARIGLRSSANPPPPIGGRKRRKTFR